MVKGDQMIDNKDLSQKIAQIFQSNLGNKLTLELANGMIAAIQQCLPAQQEVVNDNNTTTDSSGK